MASIDLKRVYRDHYKAGREPALVDVPLRAHLMIDGAGDPNLSQDYTDAVSALYPIAYGLRAAIKAESGDGYTVMPLEGLWWADDMDEFSMEDKSNWKWRMMILQPKLVTREMAAEIIPTITRKKNLVAGHRVRLADYGDGPSAQIMHIGPYAAEAPTIRRLHDFITGEGLSLAGLHHEIYLGDPRRTDPAKLKTIIRQPVAPG